MTRRPPPRPHNAINKAFFEAQQKTEFAQLCFALADELLERLDAAGDKGVGVDVLLRICRKRGMSPQNAQNIITLMVGKNDILRDGNHVHLAPHMRKPPKHTGSRGGY